MLKMVGLMEVNVSERNVNRAGANAIACAVSDMTPAIMKSSFLDIWNGRIAQKRFFFYACNILCHIITAALFTSLKVFAPDVAVDVRQAGTRLPDKGYCEI